MLSMQIANLLSIKSEHLIEIFNFELPLCERLIYFKYDMVLINFYTSQITVLLETLMKIIIIGLFVLYSLTACNDKNIKVSAKTDQQRADDLIIVDCLLPPQLRKLGQQTTYLTPRRPIKTTGNDCGIRGGEYVAFDRASYATALKTWLPLAQQGDPNAQTNVGEINEKGLGLMPDYKTAAHWYQKAANQNDSRAQINLGHLYEKGLGVDKNITTALNWYRKASGLTADNLEYTSSLQSLLDTHKREVVSLKDKLKQAKTKEKEVEILSKELNIMRDQIIKNNDYVNKNKLLVAQIKNLESELNNANNKKIDLFPIQQQISALQALVNVTVPLTPLSNAITRKAPSIEIIDPAISLTRGSKTAMLKPAISSREIIGKISAPAGLKYFKINNNPHKIDEHNLFWVTVPITQQNTPIVISAEDSLGQMVNIEFSLFSNRHVKNIPRLKGASNPLNSHFELGDYYAIIIGNNNYQHYSSLNTAVNDAEETAHILEKNYGFKTLLLKNATRFKILSTLNDLRRELKPQDNLLIYYAGHGEIDSKDGSGYWLPVDAKSETPENWISNSAISDILSTVKAKHIMVVADSCYSGTLSATSIPRTNTNFSPSIHKEWVNIMATTPARMALTSGGVQPVIDNGGGNHSIFAKAFLGALTNNKGLLEGYSLYTTILSEMRKLSHELNIDQIPDYAPIKHAGHEAGEFFFQRI